MATASKASVQRGFWLFAPETDLAAYRESLDRLAALAPELTLVLPAHNTPVAAPSRLEELREAFAAVEAGAVEATPGEGGLVEYELEGFSFLMPASTARSIGAID